MNFKEKLNELRESLYKPEINDRPSNNSKKLNPDESKKLITQANKELSSIQTKLNNVEKDIKDVESGKIKYIGPAAYMGYLQDKAKYHAEIDYWSTVKSWAEKGYDYTEESVFNFKADWEEIKKKVKNFFGKESFKESNFKPEIIIYPNPSTDIKGDSSTLTNYKQEAKQELKDLYLKLEDTTSHIDIGVIKSDLSYWTTLLYWAEKGYDLPASNQFRPIQAIKNLWNKFSDTVKRHFK